MPTTDLTTASTFAIRELTGQLRVLELAGRALPYRPFQLTGSMRTDFAWYPGSPIATVQVLGASEEETVITGAWKDRFIGDPDVVYAELTEGGLVGGPIRTVRELARLTDDFRRKGQLLEVTWLDHARRGILTKFSQSWMNAHDLEWEITFGWISQAESDANLSLGRRDMDLSETSADATARAQRVARATIAPFAQEPGYAAATAAAADAVLDGASALEDVALTLAQRTVDAPAALRQTAAALTFMIDGNTRAIAATLGLTDRAKIAAVPIADVTVGQSVAASKQSRDLRREARDARGAAARSRASAARRIAPDLAGVFVAREGQDLREVSRVFFGTPDEWRRIARFNNLQSSRLSAGQLVLVPRAQEAA